MKIKPGLKIKLNFNKESLVSMFDADGLRIGDFRNKVGTVSEMDSGGEYWRVRFEGLGGSQLIMEDEMLPWRKKPALTYKRAIAILEKQAKNASI